MAISNLEVEAALRELAEVPTKSEIQRLLERLPLSADAKAVLSDLANITVRVGNRVVAIGRKIIDIALAFVRAFPNMVFGVIIALVISAIVSAVPMLGGVLGAILSPLLLIFGLTTGAMHDMREGQLGARIDGFIEVVQTAFSGL